MFRITHAVRHYEYTYTAKRQRNGLFRLDCYCVGPDGYYCAGNSWTESDVSQEYIDNIFDL